MDIKASAVQFAPISLQPDRNLEAMCGFINKAAAEGAQLVVFPELSDLGYVKWPKQRKEMTFLNTYIESCSTIPGKSVNILGLSAKKNSVYVVAGLAEQDPLVPSKVYNSAALIGPDGKVIGVQRKNSYTVAEMFYFSRGNGHDVFDTDFGKLGITICYDNWIPENSRVQTLKGMDVLCSVWNLGYSNPERLDGCDCPNGFQPNTVIDTALVRALENVVYVISSNRTGFDEFSGINFFGNSSIVAPWGENIVVGEFDTEQVITADLKFDELKKLRSTRHLLKDRRPELYGIISEINEPVK
ncbi:MAG: carbon-nitrogen hydrolase family protein [Lentihominibacter sp.]|jgi:omega-amidase